MGAISRATARIAKGLGLELYGHDPFAGASAFDEVGVKRCATLDDLLAVSDILSLHCPLTEQTRTVINSATIAKLPRGAYIINTARGGLIDEAALLDEVRSGHLARAERGRAGKECVS